jgi:hypothetical protein
MNCSKPTNKWKELEAVATISGVGFFDVPDTEAARWQQAEPVMSVPKKGRSRGAPSLRLVKAVCGARSDQGSEGKGSMTEPLLM